MKKVIFFITVVLFLLQLQAQESVDEVRTQSGIDPTRVTTRIGYSFMYYAQEYPNTQINNRLVTTLGINRWSFSVKSDFVSTNNNLTNPGFNTGFGDMRFTILNAFYVGKKIALAGAVEMMFPTASSNITQRTGMGNYVMATPSITFSYTINPSLMLAIQPQYSFNLAKNAIEGMPNVGVLTTRIFLAKFTSSGMFYVLEPRPIYDFINKKFDLIIAPIIGKALGKGYNLVLLGEIPIRKETIDQVGVLIQIGISKAF